MRVHQQSTRIRIVGRKNGGSALESASYISRTSLTSEISGKTYYPKYHEDLVFSEIFLPENAPEAWGDRSVLWNSVEQTDKAKNAQLARTIKADLPNDWSYDLASGVVAEFVKKTFVDKGMCADVAIHDSVNPDGQRNLHCHIMLTMRPILENGEWGAKSKKEYILDKDGNKIKTKSGNYKSRKIDLVDWNSKDKAKEWRTALADEINRVNAEQKIDVHWEHRSFKEQGIELEPQIHLGSVASALERQGIQTERGNINREIRKRNSFILYAEKKLEWATKELASVKESIKETATDIKSELREMFSKMVEKVGHLSLPVVGGRYLRMIQNRQILQDIDKAVSFADKNGLTDFAGVQTFMDKNAPIFDNKNAMLKSKQNRLYWLNEWLKMYQDYKPCKEVHDQSAALSGFKKRKFDKEHEHDLTMYGILRERLLSELPEGEKKISPISWKKEKAEIEKWIAEQTPDISAKCYDLAMCEVIEYSQKDLQRIIGNEERAKSRQAQQSHDHSKKKNREEGL